MGIMVFDLNMLLAELLLEPSLQVTKAARSPDGRSLVWTLEDHSKERIELCSEKNWMSCNNFQYKSPTCQLTN